MPIYDPAVIVADAKTLGLGQGHWLLIDFVLLDKRGRHGMQRLLADVADGSRKRSARQVLVQLASGWRAVSSLHANFGEDDVYITSEAEAILDTIKGRGASSQESRREKRQEKPPWTEPNFWDFGRGRKKRNHGGGRKHHNDPWAVLHLRPGAPMEVVEAARRALARKAHPDAGGSEDAMKRLNEAVEQIKKLR